MNLKRGDIWRVVVGPRKLGPRRTLPCVVVSPPELHDFLATVIVAPVSTVDHAAPFRIPLTVDGKKGVILLDQLRAIDRKRLVLRIGKLGPTALRDALAALQQTFAP